MTKIPTRRVLTAAALAAATVLAANSTPAALASATDQATAHLSITRMCDHELSFSPSGQPFGRYRTCLSARHGAWKIPSDTMAVTLSGTLSDHAPRVLQLTLAGGRGTLNVRTAPDGTWSVTLTPRQALGHLQLGGNGTNTATIHTTDPDGLFVA